jgi:hypothetical protein
MGMMFAWQSQENLYRKRVQVMETGEVKRARERGIDGISFWGSRGRN